MSYGNENDAIGTLVEYVDEYGKPHDALVTALHGSELGTHAINVVIVSSDPSQTDQYGRQIARPSSVAADGPHAAHGRFYRVK